MTDEHAGAEREGRAGNDNRKQSQSARAWPKAPRKPEKSGFSQRWATAQASKKVVFLIASAAAALVVLVGFTWGGWVTGGAAQASARSAAQTAVIDRLAPMCVAQFNLDPLKDDKLVELQNASSFQRGTMVREQGWATMLGEERPDSRVADACARLLIAQ